MPRRLISRSAEHQQLHASSDLQRLQDDGYEIEVRGGNLLLGHVPFRNAEGGVAYGTLICPLDLAGNVTVQPQDHVIRLTGGVPYDAAGAKWVTVIADEQPMAVAELTTSATLSQKPLEGDRKFRDFHHKMTTYVGILSGPAREIDAEATAQTYPVFVDGDDDSIFSYPDTASSHAGITEVTEKLKVGSVAIVGLGGTGSYILDFVAKTPVEHIHLYDGDRFLQHNAFRSPGAPSVDELQEELSKVAWFERIYSRMRKNIHMHDYYVDESNVEELRDMDFVFIAADSGKAKRLIASKLEVWSIPFTDVGMGLYDCDGSIGGQLRVTTSTPDFHEHVAANHRISFAEEDGEKDGDNVYDLNIQIAELNALNAALAVIKWKKLCGFYLDDEFEHHALYVVNGNTMINEDRAA
jgi:ThiF family